MNNECEICNGTETVFEEGGPFDCICFSSLPSLSHIGGRFSNVSKSDEIISYFINDLEWLRETLINECGSLFELSPVDFKRKGCKIIFDIWSDGSNKGILSNSLPSIKMNSDNHSFSVEYGMKRVKSFAELTIFIKRNNSVWKVECL